MWHVYPPPRGYSPQLGDEVFIRPKTGKELGLTGRIVDFQSHEDDDDNRKGNKVKVAENQASSLSDKPKTKKRKREEPTRAVVSIQSTSNVDDSDTSKTTTSTGTCREVTSRPSRLVKVVYAPSSSSSPPSGDFGASEKLQPQHVKHVIVTSDTANYRILAASQVKSNDFVLEIGCSTGECTAILARYASSVRHDTGTHDEVSDGKRTKAFPGRIVAFDTGESMIAAANKRLSMGSEGNVVSFHKIDALQDPRGALKAIESSTSEEDGNKSNTGGNCPSTFPNVVFIDIGGNREMSGVVRMMHWVLHTFQSHPPRLIVVKSQELVSELRNASRNNTILLNIDDKDGTIHYGQDWFSMLADSVVDDKDGSQDDGSSKGGDGGTTRGGKNGPAKFSHPLKAPLALSPVDDATPICRFHNYHPEGCKKGESCDFDHEHCHYCLKKGHVARDCGGKSGAR
mmetsp:Transcript_23698/g.68180  ORF Transcript_23698/g.68180 Transcript_23698/m.68180 type:complete len:456 (+) Transcript_23698:38-1405(+)